MFILENKNIGNILCNFLICSFTIRFKSTVASIAKFIKLIPSTTRFGTISPLTTCPFT